MKQIALEKKENISKTTFCYTIDEIANWQKEIRGIKEEASPYEISLPSLQRGFVWKPSQIENLWDSILRGYPIGALLMNQVAIDKKELLDGQQRCTSISIGYLNPFKTNTTTQLLNIQKNIPSIWIDFKPVKDSINGTKFGIRVLTRSHPWGYQLKDNTKKLTTSDITNALTFFRKKAENAKISFSELEHSNINPWDAHCPVPLFVLLTSNLETIELWSRDIKQFIAKHLKEVKTKHSAENYVDYSSIDKDLELLYNAVIRAKQILIPEILVQQEALNEDETHETEDSDDATLFIRLNSEGTRISGEELVYSLIKSTFPEAKELVEKIDVKYIAPSKVVNLFARLSLMEIQEFEYYQKSMNLIGFRRNFYNQEFKNVLLEFIKEEGNIASEAKQLFDRAMEIVSFNADLPKVYIKHQVGSALDLFFVLLVYLHKNEDVSAEAKKTLHKDFHSIALFNEDSKKTASKFFETLKKYDFKDWDKSVIQLREEHSGLALPILSSEHFKVISTLVFDNYINDRSYHFGNWEYVKSIFKANKKTIQFLFDGITMLEGETTEEFDNRALDNVTNYWACFSNKIYWDRTFLLLAQREYFKQEFEDYMEFDGIEDTNRPWDWDHIYPNSWVYSKRGISPLVKQMINTNGNFRALSFNENRSQGNSQSPKFRFENNTNAQKGSFVKANDLVYWFQLSNTENRLKETKESKEKINAFVQASFHRMNNIYEEVFNLFRHNN